MLQVQTCFFVHSSRHQYHKYEIEFPEQSKRFQGSQSVHSRRINSIHPSSNRLLQAAYFFLRGSGGGGRSRGGVACAHVGVQIVVQQALADRGVLQHVAIELAVQVLGGWLLYL